MDIFDVLSSLEKSVRRDVSKMDTPSVMVDETAESDEVLTDDEMSKAVGDPQGGDPVGTVKPRADGYYYRKGPDGVWRKTGGKVKRPAKGSEPDQMKQNRQWVRDNLYKPQNQRSQSFVQFAEALGVKKQARRAGIIFKKD